MNKLLLIIAIFAEISFAVSPKTNEIIFKSLKIDVSQIGDEICDSIYAGLPKLETSRYRALCVAMGDVIELVQNDTVAFSGANNHFSKDSFNRYRFAMTGTIAASGNIQSLMNFSNSVTSACYYTMFGGCNSLTKAPALPATTLTDTCYFGMFQKRMTGVLIIQVPELTI